MEELNNPYIIEFSGKEFSFIAEIAEQAKLTSHDLILLAILSLGANIADGAHSRLC